MAGGARLFLHQPYRELQRSSHPMSPSLSSCQEAAACHRGLGVRAHVMQETHMAVPGWCCGEGQGRRTDRPPSARVSPTSLSRISLARSLMSCEGLKCSGSSSSCSAKACRTATHRVSRPAAKSGHGCPPSVPRPLLLYLSPIGAPSRLSLCGS